jgi:lipopolysaccharide transport system permease protein
VNTKTNSAGDVLVVEAERALLDVPGAAAAHEPAVKRIEPPGRWPAWNLQELAEYRELLYFMVWREIKVRYKQTLIGAGWAVIQPVATMLVFSLFFGRLAKIPSGGLPYPLFFYAALLPWTYFATALAGATGSVVENQRVITKVYFPRVLLPLSAMFSGLVDFAIAFALLIGMAFY